MMYFRQQTRTLIIGFSLVAALIIAILAVALLHIQESRFVLNKTIVEHNGCLDLSSQLYRTARERMDLLQNITGEADPFVRDEKIQLFWQKAGNFAQIRSALLKRDLEENELEVLERQAKLARDIVLWQEQVVDFILAEKLDSAWPIITNQIIPAHNQMLALLVTYNDFQIAEMREAIEATRQIDDRALDLLLATGGAALILILFIAIFVHRRMGNLTGRLTMTAANLESSLRELEFQKLALDKHAIINVANAKGEIQYANDLLCSISQYSQQELIGQKHTILNSGYHPDSFFANLWKTISVGKVWRGQIRNRRKDGSFYWADTTIVPFLDSDSKPYQYIAVQTDITAAKEAAAVLTRGKEDLEAMVMERTTDLQERQVLLQKITSAAQDAIIMIDDQDNITFWNEAAEKTFGFSENQAMGRKLHDLIMPPQYRSRFEPGFMQFSQTGQGNFIGARREVVAMRHDGTEFPVELSLSAVRIKERWTALGIARDITERKAAEAALSQLASTDPLTGIANRRRLDTELEQEMKRAERYHTPLSIVMFDVDHFKKVNDTYGHPVGDRVLIDLATLIAGNIRTHDLLARWGGEEFVILTHNCEAEVAANLSEKLRSAIEEFEFHTVGKVTCSFGVTSFHPGESVHELVSRADKALYLAKMRGRNCVEIT